MNIRNIEKRDAALMADIYNYYVENSVYTFDENPAGEQYFIEKIKTRQDKFPCLALEIDGKFAGFAYASAFAQKPAYRYTVESTIYLDYHYAGRGAGTYLYTELLKGLKDRGFRRVIAVLGIPNKASESLHKKMGFTSGGGLNKVGFKFNKWIDIGYWQLDLDFWEPEVNEG